LIVKINGNRGAQQEIFDVKNDLIGHLESDKRSDSNSQCC